MSEDKKKKQLLFSVTKDDFEVQTFRAGGKGGQNQNKRDTGVRIVHRESGAVGEARDERSQAQNKKLAFHRLIESKKFQVWLKVQSAAKLQGYRNMEQMIEKKVNEDMRDENLKVEYYDPDEG
jgi:protein subunit release factor B